MLSTPVSIREQIFSFAKATKEKTHEPLWYSNTEDYQDITCKK